MGRNKPEEICGFRGCLSDLGSIGTAYRIFLPVLWRDPLIVSPTQWSEAEGSGLWHVRYRVRNYNKQRLEGDVTKTMLVHTRSTQQRLGAEDGVEIFGFSDPSVEQDMKAVAMRR